MFHMHALKLYKYKTIITISKEDHTIKMSYLERNKEYSFQIGHQTAEIKISEHTPCYRQPGHHNGHHRHQLDKYVQART